MPRLTPFEIVLTEEEQWVLERLARATTAPYRDVVRARIILYAAEGWSNQAIGARLDTPREIVRKWRRRFLEHRLAGLEDSARAGRPVRFSPQRGGRREGSRMRTSSRIRATALPVEHVGDP